MKKIFEILGIIIIGIAIGIIIRNSMQTAHYKKVESYEIIAKIIITEDFINVREQPTTKAAKIFEVIKTEQYNVVGTFKEENGGYTWYKIIFSDRRIGWVASYDEKPWVEVIK